MNEQGRVSRLENNRVIVKVIASEGCGLCAQRSGCSVIGRELAAVAKKNEILAVGDDVELEINTKTRPLGFIVFTAIPLLAIAIGFFVGNKFFISLSDSSRAVICILSAVIGFAIAMIVAKRIPSLTKLPVAKKIRNTNI